MRIKFKKSDLEPAAAVVMNVANQQSSLPILANVLIDTEHDNVVTFLATDYETRVKIEVPAEVEKKGAATAPAKTFCDLVRELPEDGTVTLETKDKALIVKCRDIRCELQTMPVRDFPKFPALDPKISFDMPQKELKEILHRVVFAIPARDPRKVLLGALFEFRKGLLNVVATDGKILAYVQRPVKAKTAPEDLNVVIQHKILEELARTLHDDGDVNVSFDAKQVAFRFNDLLFVANQIEGKYPNYDAVVPKEFSRELRFQKEPMLRAVRRASVLTDIKNLAVVLAFKDDHVSVEAESYDKGRLHEELPAVVDGDAFKIVFNHRYLSDVLKAIDKEEIVVQANQPTTPAVFRGANTGDSFYLIMPIKLAEVPEYEGEDYEPETSGAAAEE